jgi:outer membrane lipoprotein-sorting protein
MTPLNLLKRGLSPFLIVGVLAAAAHAQGLGGEARSRSDATRALQLLSRAQDAIAAVEDYEGILVKQERFGDELSTQSIKFKFAKPFKVYVKYLKPISGQEGIYRRGVNDNKVRAHKGSFPDITVNLDPLGRRAMENNHHPITSFGIETMLRIARYNLKRGIRRGDVSVTVTDGGFIDDRPVWLIDAKFSSDGRTIPVRNGEDVWAFADRVGQDMYVILHHNEQIDSPSDVSAGDEVFVPYHYASRSQYYIDKSTNMLLKINSWDHEGRLYESYEYRNVELNPGLDQWDFDPRNQAYDFAD